MKPFTKASYSDAPSTLEKENLSVARQAACEGIVLLRNNRHVLPLTPRRVALYGPGAAHTVKGGVGSGEVNERRSISVREGLEAHGFEIATDAWLQDYETVFRRTHESFTASRRKQVSLLRPVKTLMKVLFDTCPIPLGRAITESDVEASATDTCIYVLSRQAGEGVDRQAVKGDYYISDNEEAAIRFCASHYENFILLLNIGGVIDPGFLDRIPGIDAVVHISQPGTEGGNAVADVLTGDVAPSGKLTDSWAKNYADLPFSDEYGAPSGEQVAYKEGIFVGYRYFDTFGVEPYFPFGFGLGYTEFDIRCADVSAIGSQIHTLTTVENVGHTHGREVPQLYLSAPGAHREAQSLAAFAKTTELLAGQSQTMDLTFDLRNFAAYRESDHSFILEPGEYLLRLGNSSRNTVPVAVIVLDREILCSRLSPICPASEPVDELQPPVRETPVYDGALPRVLVKEKSIRPEIRDGEPAEPAESPRVQAFLDGLTPREMAEIVVGVGMQDSSGRFCLPGSVGNTTSAFWDRGLASAPMCDGPAGLRLQRRSTKASSGKLKPLDFPMSGFNYLPDTARKLLCGNPEREPVLYQYATAFPVATALAQSWNPDLLEKVGRAIFREMREYGCAFWLAPAVNLHRNPLCGRNFEYFSEDPRLTGRMAAALVRGVQQEPGYYATVKHFAANNQEFARQTASSNLSERTLRELYLKAFEIVVREADVKAVMTSYNRLNGVYTPEQSDLCTRVLRQEWGFDGVVMTDWGSTGEGRADAALAIHAGNDLIMPGSKADRQAILAGLKSGSCTEQDLRRSCARVVRAVFDTAVQREFVDPAPAPKR